MRTLNYILAIASLVVGVTLCIFAFAIDGLSTTLGVILGILLIINGVLRLWLLKKKIPDNKPPMSCEGD
jgi:hypothetical protein